MIKLLCCCKGLCKKPDMNKWSDAEIIGLLDPMKPGDVDSGDKDCHEYIYDSEKIRIHVIENMNSVIDEYDYFHCLQKSFLQIEVGTEGFIKVIELQKHKKYIVAYEKLETEEDTEYFEEIILELIRVSTTALLVSSGPNSDFIIKTIKQHIEAGIVYENED